MKCRCGCPQAVRSQSQLQLGHSTSNCCHLVHNWPGKDFILFPDAVFQVKMTFSFLLDSSHLWQTTLSLAMRCLMQTDRYCIAGLIQAPHFTLFPSNVVFMQFILFLQEHRSYGKIQKRPIKVIISNPFVREAYGTLDQDVPNTKQILFTALDPNKRQCQDTKCIISAAGSG